jgi:hypothetical protein
MFHLKTSIIHLELILALHNLGIEVLIDLDVKLVS